MKEPTKDKLVTAAAQLLDQGGIEAVTLRGVAERVGVSHNAPYKHFEDRSALLAAVAERDFVALRIAFEQALDRRDGAGVALRAALGAFIDYGLQHPARYRLLFSDPSLPSGGALKEKAFASFTAFLRIVEVCQREGSLPAGDPVPLAGLIYATVHGAIDLEIGGRANNEKGLVNVTDTLDLLLRLLAA
ncbi:MAG: TetR/AcrR family transcriptional regulator [Rhizobiaceae bacterium]|nr:TetR/AcrR family transcriptional regulator [Rhizobiaceae bacterium]